MSVSSNSIKTKRILVVGDVMVDTYYTGEVSRISPEAPVPVFKKKREQSVLGGAANVAVNLVAAGQKVSMMSICGNDNDGNLLIKKFREQSINTELILRTNKPTTVKTRFMASNNQQVLRLDVEDTTPISSEDSNNLIMKLSKNIDYFDLIILSDYMKGFLTFEFTQSVIQLANTHGKKVLVDVKDPLSEKYKGAFLLKPNQKELHMLTNMPVNNDEQIIMAAKWLLKHCGSTYVLTTCGPRGMLLVSEDSIFSVSSVVKEVFDVTGAGDTTISYLGACIANNIDMQRAVEISNYAAGIQVSKVGTSAVYLYEVKEFLNSGSSKTISKMLSYSDIETFRTENADKKIVFTNGCFDILHVGHIRYLMKAAEQGDILVVGLNSDNSVRRLKGPDRPVNCQEDRAELLCALGFVDYVIIFDEDTPYELISKVQPDVLVKGGDYKPNQVVGKNIVESRGGKLVLINFVEGKSTTNIINKMKN